MEEKRSKGRKRKRQDAAAAARKEDARANHWGDMSERERTAAKEAVKAATANLKELLAEGGSNLALRKRAAQNELQRARDVIPAVAHGGS